MWERCWEGDIRWVEHDTCLFCRHREPLFLRRGNLSTAWEFSNILRCGYLEEKEPINRGHTLKVA